jgi:ribonuclease BN (tRNA processing enzyme)
MIKVYPLTNIAVFSTSTLIDREGKRMLMDMGPGCLLRMMDQGLPLSKVDLILISHLHIDHFWDLAPLLWFKSTLGLRRKGEGFWSREG